MAEAALFTDLAVVLLVAGATALLFHLLRQPVILGYLVAGFVVGPYSWGPSFVSDAEAMRSLGEMGIVFLLFALGLEFSLGKLRKVGATAIVAGTIEIAIMLLLGYGIGRALGWSPLAATFLGGIMSVSSTTIIVKVLQETGQKDEEWARTAFGILIVEDILAVLLLTGLSSAAATGNFQPELLGGLLVKLGVFLGAALVLGFLILPRAVEKITALEVEEVMVLVAVGIGFGMALLASTLGFSAGLGAFVAGALMAESPRVARIVPKVAPLRDVFTAIFFVTVGAALDPAVLAGSWAPVLLVTAGVLAGKILAVSLATFVTGEPPGKALRVGMALAQIGEFGFIIAALGASLGVVPPTLYPVAIAVCALTAFATPRLVRAAPRVVAGLERRVPVGLHAYMATYGSWVRRVGRSSRQDPAWAEVRANALKALLVAAVLVALFAGAGYAGEAVHAALVGVVPLPWGFLPLEWIAVALLAAPFLVVGVQAARRLVVSLARLAVPERLRRAECTSTERILRRTFGLAATILAGVFFVVLVGTFVESLLYVLVPALGAVAVSTVFLGRSLGGFHREVERTIERVMKGSDGHEDRHDAVRRLESVHAWGAESREVLLPQVSGAGGRTLAQLRLRELTGASVLLVHRGPPDGEQGAQHLEPLPGLRFEAGDRVLLVGEDAALTRAEEVLLGRDLGVSGGATEFRVGPASALLGRPLAALALPPEVQVLLVRRGETPLPADGDLVLEPGDVVVVTGPDAQVEKMAALAAP